MHTQCLFSTLALSLFFGNANALTSFELHNINQAHEQGFTGEGVNIAVVDAQFYPEHDLLNGQFLEPPINNTYTGYQDHANHVAGIAAANTTNRESYGIATDSKILAFGSLGLNTQWNDFKKILSYDVKVVNNSHTATLLTLQDFAQNNDILIVYASGNSSTLSPNFAARQGTGSNKNLGAWLTVGNIDPNHVTRTNGKLNVDPYAVGGSGFADTQLCKGATAYCVMAAGTGIKSAGQTGISDSSGSSMAAPVVTGIAALIAEKYPFLGGKQLADVILSTANKDFTTPDVIYKQIITGTTTTYEVIYIDKTAPTDKQQVIEDIKKVYGSSLLTYDSTTGASNFNVSSLNKEEVYGQGIVDAAKALKGLALIDINRLSANDVQGTTVFYTINTDGHSALFENNIDERKWDDKYHTENTTTQAALQTALKNKNAGLKKTGKGTLLLSGDLNYSGDTNIEGGTLALVRPMSTVSERSAQLPSASAVALNLQGNVHVGTAGVLDISREANLQQNLNNAGTTHINSETNIVQNFENQGTANINAKITAANLNNSGTMNVDATTKITDNLSNSGTLQVGVTSVQTLTVGNTFTQTADATLQLGFLVDNATNSALKAQTYDIKGGTLLYAPLSASVVARTIEFDLQGLQDYLGAFNNIGLTANGYALSYALLPGNTGVTISARPNVYADFNGANASLARVLRSMSSANLSTNYTNFFAQLNNANFATYRAALLDLNDLSHLRYNNLLLELHNQDVLEKVVNLQTEAEGVFLRPRYARLKAGLKAHRAGFEFYANRNTTIGALSTFINYDNLSGSDASSQLVSFGTGIRNTATPLGIFGGLRMGFANNTVKKTQELKYQTRTASLFLGVDKDFTWSGTARFIPTFYVNYHYFHQEKFHHKGTNGTILQAGGFPNPLFARDIRAKNSNFVSANLGLTFKQNLAQTWNLDIHGFFERRLLGDKFKSTAQFVDFDGAFEQTLNINQNFFRVGFDLNYESPIKANGIGYFASIGVDYEISDASADKYRAFGADLKGGIKF